MSLFLKNYSFPSQQTTSSDVSWKPPKGPNFWDLQETSREISEDQFKNWWFSEKIAIVLVLLFYSYFLQKEKIFKISKWTRSRLQDVLVTKWWDVRVTSCYLYSTYKHSKLIWPSIQDFIVNSSSKKFCDQYGG